MSHRHRSQDLWVSELWGLLLLKLGISPNSLDPQKTLQSSVPLVNRGFVSSRNLRVEHADCLSWGLKAPRGPARAQNFRARREGSGTTCQGGNGDTLPRPVSSLGAETTAYLPPLPCVCFPHEVLALGSLRRGVYFFRG